MKRRQRRERLRQFSRGIEGGGSRRMSDPEARLGSRSRAGLARRDPRPGELTKAERHALIETLKGVRVPVSDTLGFERAEVTAGGLALSAVDPGTMRVRGLPGLRVIGELLDRAGPIGGLNFQAAFAEAELAAR